MCAASVRMPACEPVSETASWPRSWIAIATRAHAIRSPVESSMSNSRTFGVGETWWARSISPSVVLPIAETVPTTRRPRCFASTRRRATCLILSGSATDEPPNFITTVSKSTGGAYRPRSGARPACRARERRGVLQRPPVPVVPSGGDVRARGARSRQPRPLQPPSHGLHLEREQRAGAARGGALLLARRPRPGGGRPRDPARGVRLPSAVARGLVAVRPAAEDRRLRRLRLPRRVRRLERRRPGRARRAALLLLRSLPRHAAPRRGAVDHGPARALRQARRARRRSGAAAARGRRRARRQLLPPPRRDRRPHRRARGGDLPRCRRGAAAGDLHDEARARRHAQGDRAATRPLRLDRRRGASRSRG